MTLFNAQENYLIGPELPLTTKQGTQIPNEQRSALPMARMDAAKDIWLLKHSSARIRSLSSVYNCMGMVFATRRTWVDPQHLSLILNDDGYRRVPDQAGLEEGDVIVYKNTAGQVSHVGIIARLAVGLAGQPPQIFVLSQWGRDGEYFHRADDVPELLGIPAEYWTDRA